MAESPSFPKGTKVRVTPNYGDRSSFTEGVVVGVETCSADVPRYRVRVTRRVEDGVEVLPPEYSYPPLNGTVRWNGVVNFSVEAL